MRNTYSYKDIDMSKRNKFVERTFYGYASLLLAISLFCFITSFIGAFSSVVNAAEMNHDRYEVLYKQPHEDAAVTKEVCDVVAKSSGIIKKMFDKGYTDEIIGIKLSEAIIKDVGNRDAWIAYHLVASPNTLAAMREWPAEASYSWMEQQFPDITGSEYYQIYAGGKCDQSIGKTVKVLQVKNLGK